MRKSVAILVAALLLGTAGLANAQVRATGTISGAATDSDGAALPGVQVTATSPSLIGEQVAYTSANGGFRLTLLPPGVYQLVFELQGFATVVREDVDVGVGRNTTINTTMGLAAVEETITVTGKSPLVDIKSTKRASEYSDELRNTLPEPRGVGGDLMSLAPEASIPAGNSSGTGSPSFFGSPTNSNAYQIDGVTVTDPGGGFQFPFYSPDWFEVVELTSTGAGADYGKAMGAVFNVVTKSGGNSYHGETNYFFQNNSFVDDNTEGIESEVADFTPAEISYRHDFTANIGGPVRKDEIWFFAGYQAFYENFRNPGVIFDQLENSDRFFGKLTWQLNADNRLITSVMADTYTLDGRPGRPNTEPEATAHEPSMNITPNITWNSVLSPDAFLELKYSGFYGYFDLIPISEAPAVFELSNGNLSNAYWGFYTFDRARTNIQGNLSYFAEDYAGDHAFKFGAEWERNLTDDHGALGPASGNVPGGFPAGTGVTYYPYLGEPYLAYTFDPGKSRNTSLINVSTFYAQDDWTVHDRVTLNLGVRFDHWAIGWKGASRADAPTFNDWAPRLGVNFDVMGDGRTSLHAFYGRFYEEAHGSVFDNYDPQRSAFVGHFWTGSGWNEFFRSAPLVNIAIGDGLRNTFSDQFTVGLDHQLFEDWSVGFKYVRKEDDDISAAENQGNLYVPITVTTDDGNTLQIWSAVPSYSPFHVLVNNPAARYVGNSFRDYNGFQFKVNKRLADNWAFIGSLLIQEAEGNISNTSGGNLGSQSAYDSPNDFVNTPGLLPNSRRYSSKFQGSWLTPDPVRLLIGGQLDVASSARFSITERFSRSATGGVPSSDRTVPIRTIGSETFDAFVKLNLRFEKKFQLRGGWGDLGVVFDIFNLANSNRTTSIFSRVPFHGEITRIMTPREYRLGIRWLF